MLLAPINSLLYLFSKTKAGAFIPVADFPEIKPLQDNWQIIRDEALALNTDGAIAAATGYNDIGLIPSFGQAGNAFTSTGTEKRWHQPNAIVLKR